MDALRWALNAAALLVLFYAVRVVLQGRDPEHADHEYRNAKQYLEQGKSPAILDQFFAHFSFHMFTNCYEFAHS